MAMPAPPDKPTRNRGFGLGLLIGLLVSAVIVIVGLNIWVSSSNSETGTGRASPPTSVTPSPSPTPSTSPKPQKPKSVVTGVFNEESPSRGDRVLFGVIWSDPPQHPRSGCTLHTYTYRDKLHGAFESDCQDWESSGYDILLFHVGVRNTSKQALTINLRNFVLQSRDERTFGPVNVRSQADFPTSFLPETLKLPPKATWRGYVTFDGRVEGLVPASISYIDGKQTLKQEFRGNAGVQ